MLPNKSFERSANSAAFMREAWLPPQLCARPVNSSVMLLRLRCLDYKMTA